MQLATSRRESGRERATRPLLPGSFRLPAAVLLAACTVVTALLGIAFAGQRQPSRLDAAVDPALQSSIGHVIVLLNVSDVLGTLIPVSLMTLALIVACLATRRWSGALLALIATPAASALTELVLKPLVDRTIRGYLTYPSGHATSMFALAGTCAVLLIDPAWPRVRTAVRLLLTALVLLLATTVALAMVARSSHYFTDVVAGAAIGIGMVLACALALDFLGRRRSRKQLDTGEIRAVTH
jgi:membrane-associated phospholipid phosphatase